MRPSVASHLVAALLLVALAAPSDGQSSFAWWKSDQFQKDLALSSDQSREEFRSVGSGERQPAGLSPPDHAPTPGAISPKRESRAAKVMNSVPRQLRR